MPPPPARAQAAALEGVWELEDPATDQRRVDGSLFDGVVRTALMGDAAADGEASEAEAKQPTRAELLKIIKETLRNSSSVTSFVLVVPHVDPKSGLFASYRLIRNGTYRQAGPQVGAPGGTAEPHAAARGCPAAPGAQPPMRRAGLHLATSRRSSSPS